jgi:hypothetical protein
MASVPNRQFNAPAPRAVVVLTAGLAAAEVAAILDRIERVNRLQPRSPAYLFVSPSGHAYVLNEQQGLLQQWIRERTAWFVGIYDARGSDHTLKPDAEHLQGDLVEHLSTLPGWVS